MSVLSSSVAGLSALERLQIALDSTASLRTRIVWLVGRPGTGKTRLLQDLARARPDCEYINVNHDAAQPKRRFLPVFMSDEGRVFMPTARRLWDLLLAETLAAPTRLLMGTEALDAYAAARSAALQQRFSEMTAEHQLSTTREAERMEYAFAARKRLIDRVGLPGVRNRRIALLEDETAAWRQKASSEMQNTPTLTAICMLRVGD